jgi:hypothetical protein
MMTIYLSSFYEAKKVFDPIAQPYIKTHACPNDCMFFYEGQKNFIASLKCTTKWYNINLLGQKLPR